MSLEAALAELNENIKIQNKLLKQSIESRDAFVETAGKLAPAKTSKPAKAEKEDKPAKSSKSEKVTEAHVRNAFGDFMSVEDEDELDKRKALVVKFLKGYGVKKATEIPEEERAEALAAFEKAVKKYEADSEDEDDRPAKKKAKRDEDEDDEDERPAKKKASRRDEDDEDEDEDEEDDE